jgi:F0F1-type ATP synthase assembly protein I
MDHLVCAIGGTESPGLARGLLLDNDFEGRGIMNRIFTLIGVVLGVLAVVLQVANIAPGSVDLLQDGAIIAIGVGVMTGQ